MIIPWSKPQHFSQSHTHPSESPHPTKQTYIWLCKLKYRSTSILTSHLQHWGRLTNDLSVLYSVRDRRTPTPEKSTTTTSSQANLSYWTADSGASMFVFDCLRKLRYLTSVITIVLFVLFALVTVHGFFSMRSSFDVWIDCRSRLFWGFCEFIFMGRFLINAFYNVLWFDAKIVLIKHFTVRFSTVCFIVFHLPIIVFNVTK